MITDKLYRSLSAWPGLQRQFARVVKRLPHRRRQVSRYGQILEIDPSEMAGFYLYYEQDYDNYLFEFLSTQVSKFERALDIGLRDADAGIGHRDHQIARAVDFRRNGHHATGTGEFHRVGQEMAQHLRQPSLVGAEQW